MGEEIFEYAGFKKRVAAAVVDIFLNILLIWPLQSLSAYLSLVTGSLVPVVLSELAVTVLFLILMTKYGVTPGKYLLKIRVISIYTSDFIKPANALLREWDTLLLSLQYLLVVYTALPRISSDYVPEYSFFVGDIFFETSGYSDDFTPYLMLYVIFDIGYILLNKKKRAIHDVIAGSVVVTKDSLDQVREELKTIDQSGD